MYARAIFVFSSLACASHARRVQSSSVRMRSSLKDLSDLPLQLIDVFPKPHALAHVRSDELANAKGASNPWELFAELLLKLSPAGAFSLPDIGARSAAADQTSTRTLAHRAQLNRYRMQEAEDDMDWREMRARLVEQEKRAQQAESGNNSTEVSSGSGYVFESPLIEQGTVILGGTLQEFGFALRQQYFHKCVMLVLSHDGTYTKGIILNRPSAYELDGWRVWCGGDVAEGGLFRGADEAKGRQEIVCLHSLEGEMAANVSEPIIKGVSYTTFELAKAMVLEGKAKKNDFWVFVGCAGWGPGQLQREVDRNSWFLANADSGTLLKELLRQGTELPPPSTGELPGDGLATWEKLMTGIGRSDEVERASGSLSDRMLSEWCRYRLVPQEETKMAARKELSLPIGTVLRTGSVSPRTLLSDQFLHKSLLLSVAELPDGRILSVVLNRPTANVVQFNMDTKPRRCISFGGKAQMLRAGFGIDENGLMWLYKGRDPLGTELGDSGLRLAPSDEAIDALQEGKVDLQDFLLIQGLTLFTEDQIVSMMEDSELHVVEDPQLLWPQVFELPQASNMDETKVGSLLGDGTGVWWSASQPKKTLEGLQAIPATPLADEALAEWLKVFAGHDSPGEGEKQKAE